MQGYRQAPPSVPLLTTVGGLLLAVDPDSGALLWSAKLERMIGRLIVCGNIVFIATRGPEVSADSHVLMLDVMTGTQRGAFDVGFAIEAALTRGERIFFAGRQGCVALSVDGRVLWRIASKITKSDMWNGDERELVAQDAAGRDMWRARQQSYVQTACMVLGDVAAQADFEG